LLPLSSSRTSSFPFVAPFKLSHLQFPVVAPFKFGRASRFPSAAPFKFDAPRLPGDNSFGAGQTGRSSPVRRPRELDLPPPRRPAAPNGSAVGRVRVSHEQREPLALSDPSGLVRVTTRLPFRRASLPLSSSTLLAHHAATPSPACRRRVVSDAAPAATTRSTPYRHVGRRA